MTVTGNARRFRASRRRPSYSGLAKVLRVGSPSRLPPDNTLLGVMSGSVTLARAGDGGSLEALSGRFFCDRALSAERTGNLGLRGQPRGLCSGVKANARGEGEGRGPTPLTATPHPVSRHPWRSALVANVAPPKDARPRLPGVARPGPRVRCWRWGPGVLPESRTSVTRFGRLRRPRSRSAPPSDTGTPAPHGPFIRFLLLPPGPVGTLSAPPFTIQPTS